MSSAQVAAALGVPRATVADELNRAKLERLKVGTETLFVAPDALDALIATIDRTLREFHAANPSESGIATAALRDLVDRRIEPRVFDAVLDAAAVRGAVVVEAGRARHPKAAGSALAAEKRAADAILELLDRTGMEPPSAVEIAAVAADDPSVGRKVLGSLAGEGAIVRLNADLFYSNKAYELARERVRAALVDSPQGATAAELRTALGVSRKYAIPLLEKFDSTGFTKRTGDLRTLRA
jgi:selenocysteine-specific elongation factor